MRNGGLEAPPAVDSAQYQYRSHTVVRMGGLGCEMVRAAKCHWEASVSATLWTARWCLGAGRTRCRCLRRPLPCCWGWGCGGGGCGLVALSRGGAGLLSLFVARLLVQRWMDWMIGVGGRRSAVRRGSFDRGCMSCRMISLLCCAWQMDCMGGGWVVGWLVCLKWISGRGCC